MVLIAMFWMHVQVLFFPVDVSVSHANITPAWYFPKALPLFIEGKGKQCRLDTKAGSTN